MMEQNKNKKKILILLMSCNIEFFQKEEELCKQTWLSNIDQYDNIDYFIYTASDNDKCYINTDNHKIKVPTNDDLYSTLSKTLLTLQVLEQTQLLQDYDYIFRTDANGLTQYQKDFNNNLSKNLIESAYFTMKGDALLSEAQRDGQTSAAKKLREMLRGTKNHTRSSIKDEKQPQAWDIASKYL